MASSMIRTSWTLAFILLGGAPLACSDSGDAPDGGSPSNEEGGNAPGAGGTGAKAETSTGGVDGSGGDLGAGSGGTPIGGTRPSVEGPDSRDIPALGEPGFDPSVDPGVHPTFLDDPELNKTEDYVYVATEAGDHELAEGIVAINYDVGGADDLRAVLSSHLDALQEGHGLALYLLNGTALNDEDLLFLQMLNLEDEGLGLDHLDTLHVYGLRSLQGGVESTTETVYGNPYPHVWYNGWQGPDSEVAKGAGGWVKHIVMDDLEEIKAGSFCDTMFETMSFKGATIVREMGFGFRPRARMESIYLPSVELVETHAFRRSQYLLKVNLPKVKIIEDFAFDDNSRLEFISAPELEWIGRNGLNDTHELISVHFPKLEYVGINCFDLQYKLEVLRLPSVTEVRDNGLEGFEALTFAYLPQVEKLNSRSLINCNVLEAVYLGTVPPQQNSDVFTNTGDALSIYYSGDDSGWNDWIPTGNESAPVVRQ